VKTGRFALFVVLLAGLFVFPFQPGASADPSPAQLRKLTKDAARLNQLYRGQIQSLEELRIQAKRALDNSDGLQKRLDAARTEVRTIAQTTYIAGPIDGFQLFSFKTEPHAMLGQAANLGHMAEERIHKVRRVEKMIEDAKKAKLAANDKIKKMEREVKTLMGKRREVERLLAKYGFQQPGGAEGLTQRMISVRAEVMQNFPMPHGVGCLRRGDPGEHGKGRACDFMISGGGSVAGGADAARGDALAEWLIQNGSRLGVMYIIWKQRYYDIRSGGGWDPMSDRGGATANHYDHVHVSVF
jgi:hypothetical protein